MPFAPHNRVTVSGIFGPIATPVEEWSWSFATAPNTSGEPASFTSLADAVATAYDTHLGSYFGNQVVRTRVRAAAINENGHVPQTTDGQYLQGDNLIPKTGAGTQAGQPLLQQALAVSLMTPRAGASGRGRFFLPAPIHAVGTSYLYADAACQTMASQCALFLSAVANFQGFVGGIAVASSKGFLSPVNQVRVGNVPDTMRSRRGRLNEVYKFASVTG